MKFKKLGIALLLASSLTLAACSNANNADSSNTEVIASKKVKIIKKNNSQLGPVVGTIAGKSIRANQLMRNDAKWGGGYGTPSDGKDTNKSHGATRRLTKKAKSIIIYWSRSGSTELLASKIAKKTNADIFEIRLRNPYPANYKKTLARANKERETGRPPKVIKDLPNLKQYKTIYVGYQTWAMTLSQPMQGFFKQYGGQFKNKIIAPFETQGGYGAGDSIDVMKNLIREKGGKNNTYASDLIIDGNKVNKSNTNKKVDKWVKKVKAIKN